MAQSGITVQELAVDAMMLASYTKFKLNGLCDCLKSGVIINDENLAWAEAAAINEGRRKIVDQLSKPMVARDMSEATRRY